MISSKNDHHEGRPVIALPTHHRRHSADFTDTLDIPAGLAGVVHTVESHGANPWTRYTVRFSDGTTAFGLVLGDDIRWDHQQLSDQPVDMGCVVAVCTCGWRSTPTNAPDHLRRTFRAHVRAEMRFQLRGAGRK